MQLRYIIAGVLVLGLLLGYCQLTYPERAYRSLAGLGRGPVYTYRYKLTLEVETANGVRGGSSVVELFQQHVSFPHGGVSAGTRGEALYIDLGPGRKPLVALLTRRNGAVSFAPKLEKLYGGKYEWVGSRNPGLAEMIRHRGEKELDMADMPELVTFADPADPKTVEPVDAENIRKALGPDVWWVRRTIELTDEPITTGLLQKLPWLPRMKGTMLDGDRLHRYDRPSFPNSLSSADFKREGY